MKNELPLRIVMDDTGISIRCLCGAEGARVGWSTGTGRQLRVVPDASAGAVLRMVAHARNCRQLADRARRNER